MLIDQWQKHKHLNLSSYHKMIRSDDLWQFVSEIALRVWMPTFLTLKQTQYCVMSYKLPCDTADLGLHPCFLFWMCQSTNHY